MITEQRIDPYSGETFTPKRRNQRFANKQNRIGYHNLKAAKLRDDKRFIDGPLSQNHKLLRELMAKLNETQFHREFLLGKGFSFPHYTGYEEYNGKRCQVVYEFLWFSIPDESGIPSEKIKVIKFKKL